MQFLASKKLIKLWVQIGVHYGGVFYEFVPWNGVVNWEVDPWGHWIFSAENETHAVITFTCSLLSLLHEQCIVSLRELAHRFSRTSSDQESIEQVEVEVTTKDPGTPLRAPTSESGFTPACKDTCFGDLRMRLWERRYNGTEGKVYFGSHSHVVSHFQIHVLLVAYTSMIFL